MTLLRIMRMSIAALFLLVSAVILVYLINRPGKQVVYPSKEKVITPQKIAKKEQIVHFQVKGERGNFLVKASKHYVGEDNKNHLEGNVEIVDFGKEESGNIYIFGEEVTYDKGMNHFLLTGKSTVKYKDLVIESDYLEYDKKKEIMKTNKGAAFTSRRISGSALKLSYSTRQQVLKLREKVNLVLEPESKDILPLNVRGTKLDYNRKKKSGEIGGGVTLSQGQSLASADSLVFFVSKDEESMKSLTLEEEVMAVLIEEDEDGNAVQKREIQADEVVLDGFKNFSRVSSITAKGNCLYKSFSSLGGFVQIQGEFLRFDFQKDGELKKFSAEKTVKMIERREAAGQERLFEGEELNFEGRTNLLQIKGKDEIKARVLTQASEILAGEIAVNLDDENMEGRDGVKIVFKGREEKESIGFFSREQPVFITAQEMRFNKEKNRFLFNKEIKVWQQKEVLSADELSLHEETGRIICSGGVKSVFYHKQKEKKLEDRIEISAEKMNFNPEKNLITYEEKGSLKVRNMNLQAPSISVHLKKEGGIIETISASDGVKIIQGNVEGKGEKASYDLEKETIALTGEPVVVDKNRGMTRGDKLTFYMADGKIIVENRKRERSETVIKS